MCHFSFCTLHLADKAVAEFSTVSYNTRVGFSYQVFSIDEIPSRVNWAHLYYVDAGKRLHIFRVGANKLVASNWRQSVTRCDSLF